MKILLLSLHWVEYLIEMANALSAQGHDVEVIFKADRVRETLGEALPQLLNSKIRFHLLDDRPRGLRDPRQFATVARLARLIRSAAPDVINLHEGTNTYLPLCLRLAAPDTPLVLTIHDVAPHPGHDSQGPRRWEQVQRAVRKRADAVILHGEWLREQYLAQPGDFCRKVHVIPHGCYTVYRHWAREGVSELPGSALFFGRIHEYKGLDYLLRAADIVARDVPDFKIIIAGDGSDLQRRHRQLLEHPRCVVHAGYLTAARVAEVFQQAAVVVLPYIEGSQSGVVRIAYVFGKPVIVTDVGSVAESVQHGVTGLIVPPHNEEALASAIIDLLQNTARRRAMGEAAARMTINDLSWSHIARRTESVYQQAATGGLRK